MINLLIYLNPDGFDQESQKLIKLQIDNSLELGWEINDILLVTDFPYEYSGIKAQIIHLENYPPRRQDIKINAVVRLFQMGMINQDFYWCHDLDAYQLEPITEQELELENFDAGFCDYCRIPQWQLGSFFFKPSAKDIFSSIADGMKPGIDQYSRPAYDEFSLMRLTDNKVGNINSRIKRLNNRYDFGMRRVDYCYEKAIKPLKVLHFHPESKLLNTLAITMHGKNRLGIPLMPERLIKIFNSYGYY